MTAVKRTLRLLCCAAIGANSFLHPEIGAAGEGASSPASPPAATAPPPAPAPPVDPASAVYAFPITPHEAALIGAGGLGVPIVEEPPEEFSLERSPRLRVNLSPSSYAKLKQDLTSLAAAYLGISSGMDFAAAQAFEKRYLQNHRLVGAEKLRRLESEWNGAENAKAMDGMRVILQRDMFRYWETQSSRDHEAEALKKALFGEFESKEEPLAEELFDWAEAALREPLDGQAVLRVLDYDVKRVKELNKKELTEERAFALREGVRAIFKDPIENAVMLALAKQDPEIAKKLDKYRYGLYSKSPRPEKEVREMSELAEGFRRGAIRNSLKAHLDGKSSGELKTWLDAISARDRKALLNYYLSHFCLEASAGVPPAPSSGPGAGALLAGMAGKDAEETAARLA